MGNSGLRIISAEKIAIVQVSDTTMLKRVTQLVTKSIFIFDFLLNGERNQLFHFGNTNFRDWETG
ncbi:MAG: hypothetical protein JWQ40_2768 [Segetibacter sp.]|jgi:hypothetical protein|nr:hypothetical protein [Segetibacter sp.]